MTEETLPKETASQVWRRAWTERLTATLMRDRQLFSDRLSQFSAEGRMAPEIDPSNVIDSEIASDTLMNTPLPYVLNVGCGFAPTAVGQRTRQGVPVSVVGVDPEAFNIGKALSAMATQFPQVSAARRFILPIVAEEMNAGIPPSSYEGVWSRDVLLDCIDPMRMLQQCVRALKPGATAAIKFNPKDEGTLWKVGNFDGGAIALKSLAGEQTITEVRGERVEVHTLQDDRLMIKIRRRAESAGSLEKSLRRVVLA